MSDIVNELENQTAEGIDQDAADIAACHTILDNLQVPRQHEDGDLTLPQRMTIALNHFIAQLSPGPDEAMLFLRVNNTAQQVHPFRLLGNASAPLLLNALDLCRLDLQMRQLKAIKEETQRQEASKITVPPAGWRPK